MFVVIGAEEPRKKGLMEELMQWMPWNQVKKEEKSFRGCQYLLLTVRTPRSPPWRRLRAMIGSGRGRTVVSPQLRLKEGCGIVPFRPVLLPIRLAVIAATQLLERGEAPKSMVAGVSDPQGLHPWCCGHLLKSCGMLRVYTQHPKRYQEEASRLLEEQGALMQITDSPQDLRGCALCVALSAGETVTRISTPVIAAPGARTRGYPTITDLVPFLRREKEDWFPPGIDRDTFLAAVMELSLRPPSLELEAEFCRLEGRRTRISDLPLLWQAAAQPAKRNDR